MIPRIELSHRFIKKYNIQELYVDPVNGDNSNPGTSDLPLRDLWIALTQCENYTRTYIKVAPNSVITIPPNYDHSYYKWVIHGHKCIYILGNGLQLNTTTIVANSKNYMSGFNLQGVIGLWIGDISIQLANKLDAALPWALTDGGTCSLFCVDHPTFGDIAFFNTSINLGTDGANLVKTGRYGWNGHIRVSVDATCSITTNSSGYVVKTGKGLIWLLKRPTATIDDPTYWTNYVISDVDGTKVNILSNIVL